MYRYPTGILQGQLNLLDSHDVNRFMSYCQNDIRRFRLAEVFLFTSPGAPSVFYGDELGMDGNSEFTLRGPMPWKGPKHDEREFFRQLITLRKENEALMTGTFQTTAASESGLLIYRREKITIALNGRNGTVSIGKCTPDREAVLSYEFSGGTLGPFGYAIFVAQ